MKYINHLNAVIAIIALVIIVQTLTKTFWESEPEAPSRVEVPQVQPTVTSAPPVARPAPLAPYSAGDVRQAVPAPAASAADQTAPVGGVAGGTPGPASVLPPSGGAVGSVESQPGVIGRPGSQTGGALRTQPSGIRRPTGRTPAGQQPRSSVFIPPPRTDPAAKRQPDSNPRVPPSRGSAPQQ